MKYFCKSPVQFAKLVFTPIEQLGMGVGMGVGEPLFSLNDHNHTTQVTFNAEASEVGGMVCCRAQCIFQQNLSFVH